MITVFPGSLIAWGKNNEENQYVKIDASIQPLFELLYLVPEQQQQSMQQGMPFEPCSVHRYQMWSALYIT